MVALAFRVMMEDQETLHQLGALARSGPYIAQAGAAVVVAIEKTQYAVSDASQAIQSIILTAWAEGVGSNWVGFMGLTEVKSLWVSAGWTCWGLYSLGCQNSGSRSGQEKTQAAYRGSPS
ncbi:MAG: nitroreductase family protein [Anaerolineae bacterium]